MVKFSKVLEAQLIPEWKGAFVNYWQLKKHVKKVKLARKPNGIVRNGRYDFVPFSLDPIRSFANKITNRITESVTVQTKGNVGEGRGEDEIHDNELEQLFAEEIEVKAFFERLDEEFDKVNEFYKTKESEFIKRGVLLKKQLQTLWELEQLLREDSRKSNPAFKSDDRFVSLSRSYTEENSTCSESPLEFKDRSSRNSPAADNETNDLNLEISTTPITVDSTIAQSTRAISELNSLIREDLASRDPKKEGSGGDKKKIQSAKKMLRGAFVELYRGLCLLQTYSSLNMLAFVKILKKLDKVSSQQASASYLTVVKRSHFISSNKIVKLMDEVETLFIRNFTNNDRKKAMKFLKPQLQNDSHVTTFLVGLFTGCFIALFSVYIVLAQLSGIFSSTEEATYMEIVYPIFSMFALLSLHLFMYGCNLYMWNRTRINYNFIFEFQPRTALKYRDAFLICNFLMTVMVAAMVIHLLLLSRGFLPLRVNLLPRMLLLAFLSLLICPFNVFYRSTRYCFIRVMRNIAFSPFYKVLMVDFFMADQLTSQIPMIRQMESTACYFLSGTFKRHQSQTCMSDNIFGKLRNMLSFAPYHWRAMQCARRWFDEGNVDHLANFGKYVSAIVAAVTRFYLSNQKEPTQLSIFIVLVTSLVATIYQLYWDFIKDWGLLNPKSKNPWLRDDLILKNKNIYYISIAINIVLRIAWVESVMRFKIGTFQSRLLDFFLASLEVIRRGQWNFYRLENEHLNNVGMFRAVKAVPLPFTETDSDG